MLLFFYSFSFMGTSIIFGLLFPSDPPKSALPQYFFKGFYYKNLSFLEKKLIAYIQKHVPLHFSNYGIETSNQLIFMVWGKIFVENTWLFQQTRELKNHVYKYKCINWLLNYIYLWTYIHHNFNTELGYFILTFLGDNTSIISIYQFKGQMDLLSCWEILLNLFPPLFLLRNTLKYQWFYWLLPYCHINVFRHYLVFL